MTLHTVAADITFSHGVNVHFTTSTPCVILCYAV